MAGVRVWGYYSLGKACPCLCYSASTGVSNRRNCSLKGDRPGQTGSLITPWFHSGLKLCRDSAWPWAASPLHGRGSCPSPPGCLPQGPLLFLLREGPDPCCGHQARLEPGLRAAQVPQQPPGSVVNSDSAWVKSLLR